MVWICSVELRFNLRLLQGKFIVHITTSRRGGGVRELGLAPEAEAFSECLDVRWAISRLLSFTMCKITTSRRGGGQGFAPWSWSIFWVSRCQMSNFKPFHPSKCVILQHQGGEGVSWSIALPLVSHFFFLFPSHNYSSTPPLSNTMIKQNNSSIGILEQTASVESFSFFLLTNWSLESSS